MSTSNRDLWLLVLKIVNSNRAIALALQGKQLVLPTEYTAALETAQRETDALRAEILCQFPPDGRPPETGGGHIN